MKDQTPDRSAILFVARSVLRLRGSAKIIEIASTKGNVSALRAEYRGYISEAERLLKRDRIRITGAAIDLLRSEWNDMLAEHQRRPAVQV